MNIITKFLCKVLKVTTIFLIYSISYADLPTSDFSTPDLSNAKLSKSELDAIDRYVQKVKIRDGVGQLLMVGAPADIFNYQKSDQLKEIVSDLGIGSVFTNSYNYNTNKYKNDDQDLYLTSIQNFNNRLQSLASKSELGLPLLVGADFENFKFNSIPSRLLSPPSALTLGATNDGNLVRGVGKSVASQLRGLGINLVMGPVLDVDRSPQGKYSVLNNRMFAGSPERVHAMASHYMCGLKEGGIAVIGKHFPGLGAVAENPHLTMPRFEGSPKSFESQVKLYPNLKEHLDGIMTAHVDLAFLAPEKLRPTTFSSKLISDLLRSSHSVYLGDNKLDGFGLKDQVIITDDLSNMGSITEYMKEHNKDYAQIAKEAFDAGHDILLFSHIETSKGNRRGKFAQFWIDDLKNVINGLINHIESSDLIEARFRESLRRVIILKQKIKNTFYGSKKTEMVFDGETLNSFSTPNIQSKIVHNGETFGGVEDLFKRAIDKSYTTINKKIETNLTEYSPDTKICFYIDPMGTDRFKSAFEKRFKNSSFRQLPLYFKNNIDFAKIKKNIAEDLKKHDLMIMTVMSVDNSNLLEHLRLNNYRGVAEKLIVLIHDTPKLLSNEILPSATIMGSFTRHPLSFSSDIDTLNGLIKPNHISKLPLSLGDNDNFHNTDNYEFNIAPPEGFKNKIYFSTKREEDLHTKNIVLEAKIIDLNKTLTNYRFYIKISFLVFMLAFILLLIKNLYIKLSGIDEYTFAIMEPRATTINTFKHAPLITTKLTILTIAFATYLLYILNFDMALIMADTWSSLQGYLDKINHYRQ